MIDLPRAGGDSRTSMRVVQTARQREVCDLTPDVQAGVLVEAIVDAGVEP